MISNDAESEWFEVQEFGSKDSYLFKVNLDSTVQYSTVQYSTVQQVQCSTVQYSTVQYSTVH